MERGDHYKPQCLKKLWDKKNSYLYARTEGHTKSQYYQTLFKKHEDNSLAHIFIDK